MALLERPYQACACHHREDDGALVCARCQTTGQPFDGMVGRGSP